MDEEHNMSLGPVDNSESKKSKTKGKKRLPGMQIGTYSDNEYKDVCQMTRTLNNPGEEEQEDRG